MATPRVHISSTLSEFETTAAYAISAATAEALHQRGKCLIALSGGRTPRGVYRRFGDLLVSQSVDVRRIYLICVDERMVPPDDPASNYGMIQRELISRIAIPPSQVLRIRGEMNPEDAAHAYERELGKILTLFAGRCDLVLLGVGEDGHTASLFPGTDILEEQHSTVRAVFVPHLKSWRVTLTLPVINRSRAVLFLAAGKEKAPIVGNIFSSFRSRENLPATRVSPDAGSITWILDAEAASQIPPARSSPGLKAAGTVRRE